MQTIRTRYQWHLLANFSHNRVVLGLDHKHGKVRILNKITSFDVKDFESDASVSAKLVLFLEPHLNCDIFRKSEADLLGLDQDTSFPDASSEVEEAHNY
jgi:hypothetical protein